MTYTINVAAILYNVIMITIFSIECHKIFSIIHFNVSFSGRIFAHFGISIDIFLINVENNADGV